MTTVIHCPEHLNQHINSMMYSIEPI